jgi:hypothetical protein
LATAKGTEVRYFPVELCPNLQKYVN